MSVSNKDVVVASNEGQGESIEQILNDIKNVITTPEAEVLVLTEKVEDGDASNDEASNEQAESNADVGASTNIEQQRSALRQMMQDVKRTQDILDEIDAGVVECSGDEGDAENTSEEVSNMEAQSEECLVSNDVAAAIRDNVATILGNTERKAKKVYKDSGSLASKTLEDVVVSLLKQELQQWLNDNLERTVQAIVEKEIKRILPK